ncbi:amino acid adenylation domain [Thiomonas bhubaneswarensis]|uniref:Amino acid adenylation domain n=2 Tax=Thiomonas bhubaneswarensis TaxID=339866 RepID=A0A0K6I5W1_9BURK|nr:amino acid adenylation domain [Thiomonas bhubaneswarensis]
MMNDLSHASSATAVDYDPFADAAPVARVVPTTEAQREIWLACQLGGDATLAYNESITLHLHGAFDLQPLSAAVRNLTDRHDALRATLSADGQQLLIAAHLALDIPVDDLRGLAPDQRDAALSQAAAQAVSTPFDLQQGPLFRARLLRLADDHVALLLSAHHIVCDGWSFGVLVSEIGALYAAQRGEAPEPDAPASFASFAQALAEREGTEAHRADEAYWLGRYATVPAVLELPCDHTRPATRVFSSRRIDHVLPANLVSGVRQLGAKSGASLFSTLLCTFGALLQRLSGNDDVVVGVPAAGQTLPGFETVVGHGVNLLPLRLMPDAAAPLAQSLPAVQSAVLDAFEHQHYTFGTLLQKLLIERDASRVPLAPVMFNLDQAIDLRSFGELRVNVSSNPRQAENFELFVNAVPLPDGGLQLECQYAAALFDDITVRRWLASYQTLLSRLCAAPEQALGSIDIVTEADRQQLAQLNATAVPLPPGLMLHQLLHAQALRTPEATAQIAGGVPQSYAQLWAQAHRIAHALRARGVQRGSRVGLCLPRDADMLPALLGVLVAGAGYVPLDPSFPTSRLADMAEDAELALLIAKSTSAEALPWPREQSLWLDADAAIIAAQPDTAPQPDAERDATPESLAYMIYTSGSTGKPKGVMLPHRAVVNFLLAVTQRPGLKAGDMLLAVTTLSFDIAVLELLLPLANGATVLLASREQAADGFALRDLLERHPVTALQATPSTWRLLLSAGWSGNRQLKALVGGEPLPADLAAQLLRSSGEVWNMYGPTETTVWSTCWRVQEDPAGIAIGTPLANTQVWVLDQRGQLCPIGVPGEIHIGGASVALGYWRRETLTAERFIPDAFSTEPGARLYRTGDRGRWRNDGQLEHLGRLDFQVKLRGFRIELGDIESHLTQHPDVAQAVALVREDTPGDARLVAYVVPPQGHTAPTAAALRAHLSASLPAYMMPQHFVALDKLPLLPNGKIDRKRLPAPQPDQTVAAPSRVAARNDVEQTVMTVMEKVLKLPALSVHDDFFALGGHSLLAAQLIAQLNNAFQLHLPFRLVFEAPTAERMAHEIAQRLGDGKARYPVFRHDPTRKTAPLTAQQERIAFMEELHPGRVTYNTPSAHRLRGPFDLAAFERAFHAMVQRQPALRTFIQKEADGSRTQVIQDELKIAIPFTDLSGIAEKQREAELMRQMQAIVDQPMDIHQAPLFRAALFKLGPSEHAFLFMPHHIIWDGWSFDLLYEELASEYTAMVANTPPAPRPLPGTYADYAQWQAEWMQSEAFAQQLHAWNAHINSLPTPKAPSTDKPRTAGMTGEGASAWVRIDKTSTESLRAISCKADVTMTTLALAVYAAMMAQTAGSETISVGVPVRGRTLAQIESVMGFFNNLIPIQLRLDPDETVTALLRRVKQEFLNALNYQDIPFERLAMEPEMLARSKQAGLYQVLFSFQDARERPRQWGELIQSSILIFQKGATEDLGLWLMEVPSGLEGGMTYNADIYTETTATHLRERFLELVQRLIAAPDQTVGQLLDSAASPSARALAHLAAAAIPDQTPPPNVKPRQQRRALTASEQLLAEIWSPLLGIPAGDIQPQDNYFDLGGDSLSALQVIAQLHARTGRRVDARLLVFESFEQFARKLDTSKIEAPVAAARKGGLVKRLFGGLSRGG